MRRMDLCEALGSLRKFKNFTILQQCLQEVSHLVLRLYNFLEMLNKILLLKIKAEIR